MSRNALLLVASSIAVLGACGTEPFSGQTPSTDVGPDAHGTDAHEDVDRDDVIAPQEDVAERRPDLDCDAPAVVWTAPRFERWLEPSWLGFAPNGGLAVMHNHGGFGSTAWRLHDGLVANGGGNAPVALSADWSVVALPGDDSVMEVYVDDALTESVAAPSLMPGWQTAVISDDGLRVAVATCNESEHLLAVLDIGSGGELEWLGFEARENECYRYPERPLLAWEPDSKAVLFAPVGAGRLARHDLEAGATTWVEAHPEVAATDVVPAYSDIYAIAVHPDGSEVATTGTGEQLRRWSLPDLAPIGEPIPAGSEALNEMTYAPWWVASPVAYSPVGDYLAHVEPGLDLVVRSLVDLEIVATIGLADFPSVPDDFMPDENAFALVKFTPDGQNLLVVAQHGALLWGCGVAERDPVDAGELEVDAPSTARVSETTFFRATLPETMADAFIHVSVNGVVADIASSATEFGYSFAEPGTYAFEFIAFDGVAEARRTVEVEVGE